MKIYREKILTAALSCIFLPLVLPAQSLQVLQPVGGEIFFIGQTARITWRSQGVIGSVRIDLLRGERAIGEIWSGVPAENTEYNWTPWVGLPEADDYVIRLTSWWNPSIVASSGVFSIRKNNTTVLAVTSPYRGETFFIGESATVAWNSNGLTGTLRIDLFKGAASAGSIASAAPVSHGFINWTPWASLADGNDYTIRLTSNANASIQASSSSFTIRARLQPVLRLIQPTDGEIFAHGDTTMIEWTSQDLTGTLRINLMKEDTPYVMIAEEWPVSERQYRWIIPDTIPVGNVYSIHLISNAVRSMQAVSAGRFTIKALTVAVELTRFDVTPGAKGMVHLYWETASESNNLGFQVQRRAGISEFQTIAFIAGSGATTTRRKYEFTDYPARIGDIHYRLRQIGFDGAFVLSATRRVLIAPPSEFSLSRNYPNPVPITVASNPVTKFDFALPSEAYVVGKIYGITGRLVETVLAGNYQSGWHTFVWKVSHTLASGIYFLHFETNGQRLVRKIHLTR
jgi:hypothetical protein